MIDIKTYKAAAFDEIIETFTKEGGSIMELFCVINTHLSAVQIMEELENKKMDKEMDW